jgi:hypothetical protein
MLLESHLQAAAKAFLQIAAMHHSRETKLCKVNLKFVLGSIRAPRILHQIELLRAGYCVPARSGSAAASWPLADRVVTAMFCMAVAWRQGIPQAR